MTQRVILLDDLVKLVEEDVGTPQRLLTCRLASTPDTASEGTVKTSNWGYAVVNERAYASRLSELCLSDENFNAKHFRSNISCFVPSSLVQVNDKNEPFIYGKDLDTGFLVIKGKVLLSRDNLVKKYGVWIGD